MKSFCLEMGIKHVLNAVCTPRANGQCERFNATILDSLRCLSVNDENETYWDKHIKIIQLGLNTSVHKITGETSYTLLMGVNPTLPSEAKIINEIAEDLARANLRELREVAGKIWKNLKGNKK